LTFISSGSGASGRVVAAVHVTSGVRVAIKYLSPRLLGTPGFLEAFRSEAALLRSLDVPSVVRLFDYVEAPGQGAAIVMELIAGVSLHEMITRQGPTGPEPALLVLEGSLQGLAAAHALGIVHRDYKPENVLVNGAGQSKLTDSGVAARAGEAASGGTPLCMAPEQWEGAPASPATDIYAATAVFFECLTGQTPFSGGLGQLAAQHAAAAVPVDLVDEPLRPLIARGMAKDPAARPSDASQFVAELKATALAAYGTGWESRGRTQLAERAAALLLLLLPHGGATAGAGTGTTTASTWLPGARVATSAGHSGLHAWLYVGIVAAVIGIAGGSLAAVSLAKSHPAATAPPSSPAASAPSKPAGPVSAACGTPGVGALAYIADVQSGQVGMTDVDVRCGAAAPVVLEQPSAGAGDLTWSPDGTQLAWMDNETVVVGRVSAGKWTLRHWSCASCTGLAFLGERAVTLDGSSSAGAAPALLVFPQSGNAQPTTLRLAGPDTHAFATEIFHLANIPGGDLVIDYGQVGGSAGDGAQLLYRVSSTGQATPYGPASLAASKIGGNLDNFTANPAGTQFAFTLGLQCGAYGGHTTADLMDTATGVLTTPAMPNGGGPDGYWVEGVWFDQSGAAYASLVPNLSDCATAPSQYPRSSGRWVPPRLWPSWWGATG
jgi:serine/threonine-protein kinase